MNNIDLLIQAINSKKPISFEYNKEGKKTGERIGNPHALYIFTPKDETKPKTTKLDLVQTFGVSDSKEGDDYPDCSQFDIDQISNVVVLIDEPDFEVLLTKFDKKQGVMKNIYNAESERYKDVIAKV